MNTSRIDHTHDVAARSWLASANMDGTDFPIQNLPLGIFRRAGTDDRLSPGIAIGDQVLDLFMLRDKRLLPVSAAAALAGTEDGTLNALMARPREARVALRHAVFDGLKAGGPNQAAWQTALVPQAGCECALPARIGDYTDFYTGIHHATTVGKLFRPDNPLLPNYKWVPIGYHGRASSIRVSGVNFQRPFGQSKGPTDAEPSLAPSRRLDYELELGMFVGAGNQPGEPIALRDADDHFFGLVLLNDWSARDVQAWEYQPLGPFLSKNFGTTVSPWIVTAEALEPFRCAFQRTSEDPQPLPYLEHASNRERGALDVQLEVWLQTAAMRAEGRGHQRLSSSNFKDSYWTLAQLLAHHTVGGCNLQPGDLLGTGTQSGPEAGQGGSMLELSLGGQRAIVLENGERRTFLEDGDSVMLKGRAERPGFRAVGFGVCEGRVLAARIP